MGVKWRTAHATRTNMGNKATREPHAPFFDHWGSDPLGIRRASQACPCADVTRFYVTSSHGLRHHVDMYRMQVRAHAEITPIMARGLGGGSVGSGRATATSEPPGGHWECAAVGRVVGSGEGSWGLPRTPSPSAWSCAWCWGGAGLIIARGLEGSHGYGGPAANESAIGGIGEGGGGTG